MGKIKYKNRFGDLTYRSGSYGSGNEYTSIKDKIKVITTTEGTIKIINYDKFNIIINIFLFYCAMLSLVFLTFLLVYFINPTSITDTIVYINISNGKVFSFYIFALIVYILVFIRCIYGIVNDTAKFNNLTFLPALIFPLFVYQIATYVDLYGTTFNLSNNLEIFMFTGNTIAFVFIFILFIFSYAFITGPKFSQPQLMKVNT